MSLRRDDRDALREPGGPLFGGEQGVLCHTQAAQSVEAGDDREPEGLR